MAENENTPIEETNGAIDEPGEPGESMSSNEEKRPMEEEAEEIAEAFAETQEEMREALGQLRAELGQLRLEEARSKVTQWIDENPALAVLIAVSGGMLVGRLLYAAFKPAPPPPLPKRIQLKSSQLAERAQDLADELGDTVRERASEAGEVLRRKAIQTGEGAAQRARAWGEQFEDTAHDVTEVVRERAERGFSLAESAWNTARTALAAVVVHRVADWVRRLR